MARNQIGTLIIAVKFIAIGVLYYLSFNYASQLIVDHQLKANASLVKEKIEREKKIPVELNLGNYRLEVIKTTEKKFDDRFFNKQYADGMDILKVQNRVIESFFIFNRKNYKIAVRVSPVKVHYVIFFGTLVVLSAALVGYTVYNQISKVTRLKFLKLLKETLTSIDASST